VYDRSDLEPEGYLNPFSHLDPNRAAIKADNKVWRQPLGQLLPDGQLVEIPAGDEPVGAQSQYVAGPNGGRDMLLNGERSRAQDARRIVRPIRSSMPDIHDSLAGHNS